MPYEYDAFPSTGQKFARYLALESGVGETPLVGRLVSSTLDNFPPYHAVSYVWGAPIAFDKLEIHGGGEIPINANLSAALRRIRDETQELMLWVDQVCINQFDYTEKASQVLMMGDIFAKAESTFICLGYWDTEEKVTKDLLALLNDVNAYLDDQLSEHEWSQMPQPRPGDLLYEDTRWTAFRALMNSSWFGRVWCVQEAGLSRNPRLLFGSAEFSWKPVFRISAYLRDAGFTISRKYGIHVHTPHLERESIWKGEEAGISWALGKEIAMSSDGYPIDKWHLLEVLQSSRLLYVTDDRDYIYAYLGQKLLAKIVGEPDYNAEPEAIYRHFAIQWLRETGDLNLLAYVQRGHRRPPGENGQKSKLRTWMPDWSRYGVYVLSQLKFRSWSAGGMFDGKSHFSVDEETGLLEVQASIIDSVTHCSPVFTYNDFSMAANGGSESVREEMSDAWPEALHQIANTQGACAYSNPYLALANTMTAGWIEDDDYGRNAAASYLSLHYTPDNDRNGSMPKGIAHGREAYSEDPSPALIFDSRASPAATGRRFIVTKDGHFGLAPAMTDVGDLCCVIRGARAAYVIRNVPEAEGQCELIGEAYVNGAMEGHFAESHASAWERIVLA